MFLYRELTVLCKYPRTETVKIRHKNYIGKLTNEQTIHFNVTDPLKKNCDYVNIGGLKTFISLCVYLDQIQREKEKKNAKIFLSI